MADPTNTGSNEIMGLGLNNAQFLEALREALNAYNVFSKQFTRTLSVRLDTSSMQGLSTAFGTQIRQAMGLVKDAQQETLRDSKKAATEITKVLSAFGGLGKKPFEEMAESARKAGAVVKSELGGLVSSAKSAGDKVGEGLAAGVKRGTDGIEDNVAAAAQKLKKLSEAGEAQARGNYQRAEALVNQLQKKADTLAKTRGLSGTELGERAGLPTSANELISGPKNTLQLDRVRAASRALKEEAGKAQIAFLAMGGAMSRESTQAEVLGAKLERLRASIAGLSSATAQRANKLFAEGQERMYNEPGGAGYAANVRRPIVPMRDINLEDLYRAKEDDEGGVSYINRQRMAAILELSIAAAKREQISLEQAARDQERAANATRKKALAEEKASTDAIKYMGARDAQSERRTASLVEQLGNALEANIKATGKATRSQIDLANANERAATLVKKSGDATAAITSIAKNARVTEHGTAKMEADFGRSIIAATSGRGANLEPRLVTKDGGRLLPPGPGSIPAGGGGPDPKKYQAAAKEATGLLSTHKGIDGWLSSHLVKMGKWVIFFKAVHEITSLIQRSIGSFVDAGISYTKELETQQLALRGILAEHAQVKDATGEILHGTAALNALQSTARDQWGQIQMAATTVVGTTADLMGLYTGILPFAAALGADLQRIQELTQATAVAGRLLDVSFQDARSAMVSLLQGRALTRNRLVGALGFDKEEIERLKEAGTLLETIEARLQSFLLLTGESQDTIAAMAESFKDFVGIVSQGFTLPATDLFKDIVRGFKDILFIGAEAGKALSGFTVRPEVTAFLSFVTRAIEEGIQPIRDFGKSLRETSVSDMQAWVVAIKEVITLLTTFGVALAKVTSFVATLVADNRELIKGLMLLAGALAAWNVAAKGYAAANNFAVGFGLMAKNGVAAAAATKAVSYEAAAAGTAMATAGTAATGLGAAIAALSRVAIVTGVVAGIGARVTALGRAKQEADALKSTLDAIANKDTQGVINESVDLLRSGNAQRRVQGGQALALQTFQVSNEADSLYSKSGRFTTSIEAFGKGSEDRVAMSNAAKEQQAASDALNKIRAEQRTLDTKIKSETNLGRPTTDLQAKFASLGNEADKLNAKLTTSTESINKLTEEMARPAKLVGEMEGLLAQEGKVRASLNDITPQGIQNLVAELGRIAPEFDQSRMKDPKTGQFLPVEQFAAKVMEIFDVARVKLGQQKSLASAYDLGQRPQVAIVPPPPEPPKLPRYVSAATDMIQSAESSVSVDTARIDSMVQQQVITEEEGIRQRQALEEGLLQFKLEIWQMEEKYFASHVEGMKKKKLETDKEQNANTFRDIAKEQQKAQDDLEKSGYRREGDAAVRARQAKETIADAVAEIARLQADAYGSVEDEALASFDRTLKDIQDRVAKVRNVSPAFAAQAEGLFAGMPGLREQVGQKARSESVIRTTSQQLNTSRDMEELLTDQFEAGTVAGETFLKRLGELRNEQTALLAQQAKAFEDRAAQLQAALNTPLPEGKTRTAESIAASTAEINSFIARAQAARKAMDDINSSARRIEAALQAWDNVAASMGAFLSAADGLEGTGTAVEGITKALSGMLSILDQIIKSTEGFIRTFDRVSQMVTLVQDAMSSLKGSGTAGPGSVSGLTGLILPGATAVGATAGVASSAASGAANAASGVAQAGSKMAAAIPLIGVGISAALAIGTAIFNRSVAKAKKDIEKSFANISKGLESGAKTLGDSVAAAEKERQRVIAQYSKSKSGRKALKEMLPDIDNTIDAMKKQAKDIQKGFDDAFKDLKLGQGPMADFARELINLEKFVREYLDSFDRSTRDGLAKFTQAQQQVNEYVSLFFENAKRTFQEEMLGFEGEALASQERLFSLIDEQDGLYRQLRDLSEDRLDLEEAVAEEQERRRESQTKLNNLLQKEADIRKKIAEVIRQANEDEMAIRRRGVLEAQLTIAQQKAMEISNVRNRAQQEIDDLTEELNSLKDEVKDETRDNQKRDRNFARQARGIAEREAEIRKAIELNKLRTEGARAVAEIEGGVFGMATDQYDLVRKQNDLAVRNAQIQVEKWRETASLVDAIKEGAEGFFFEPPPGFPQIRVQLGNIIIDNSDNSSNTFTDTGSSSSRSRGDREQTGTAKPRPKPGETGDETEAQVTGRSARLGGFGDVL